MTLVNVLIEVVILTSASPPICRPLMNKKTHLLILVKICWRYFFEIGLPKDIEFVQTVNQSCMGKAAIDIYTNARIIRYKPSHGKKIWNKIKSRVKDLSKIKRLVVKNNSFSIFFFLNYFFSFLNFFFERSNSFSFHKVFLINSNCYNMNNWFCG